MTPYNQASMTGLATRPERIPGTAEYNSRTNSLGFNPASSTYAADTNAAIARRDWERYKEAFMPLEDYLFSMVNNPAYRTQQVSQNLQDFNQTFDAGQAGFSRNLSRYGLSLSPEESSSYARMSALNKGLGQVEAVNRTNRYVDEMENQIIGAGASNKLPQGG